MGLQQSKEELLYQQLNYDNVDGIQTLRAQGADLEWIDKEGKTPLMVASMRPDLLKTPLMVTGIACLHRPPRLKNALLAAGSATA